MANLDVLNSLSQEHTELELCMGHTDSQIGPKLEACCIDNWTELLRSSETRLRIVRACSDWQARLATFIIAVSTGNKVVILPSSICWNCVNGSLSLKNLDQKAILIA